MLRLVDTQKQTGNPQPELTELEGNIVPNDATIEGLKAATGCILSDHAERYLTSKYFSVTVHGPRPIYLAHFNEQVLGEYVKAVARGMGCKMGLAEDLMCVGAHFDYCDLQRWFPVVALGSSTVLGDDIIVPFLHMWLGERSLRMRGEGGWWSAKSRFLLIGPISPECLSSRQA